MKRRWKTRCRLPTSCGARTSRRLPPTRPEQKALFEKTLLEEVAKIADEKVRGYYLQDMKNRIYERFRRPAREERTERNTDYRRSADGSGRKKNDKTAKAVAGRSR